MKKVVFVFLSICCLIIGFCFIGCEKKSFEQPPYTVYALLKDSKGNEYELRVTGGVGETMFVCERQLTYQREEGETIGFFIGELYDKNGNPLEENIINQQGKRRIAGHSLYRKRKRMKSEKLII